ncbi:thioester reductase domain-containing protein [uncultured Arsenicicoccus sp.]|uniref:thioester reductase domain-containing protein n=1 Tax=uncultured Arsenicicoccus sp. TaxID=491339 RepID=UPI002596F3FD|nr:thioester reductase domain-containing protein [uncultured Arsenicicoccus sp.]
MTATKTNDHGAEIITPGSSPESAAVTKDTVIRALQQIRQLKERLASTGASSPVNISGMAVRLPGASDSESLWDLLITGQRTPGPIPEDRWSPSPQDPAATRFGSFLADVRHFDAAAFGIPPREAAAMDPQQRLVLELAWEALEDAGYDPTSLRHSRTGVFMGIGTSDYARLRLLEQGVSNPPDVYDATGCAPNFVANRVSYTLGLEGPSLTTDTACSSSLIAVHQALGALRRGECDRALVGGVNLLLSPLPSAALAQGKMLSPTGQCHTFADDADGYVRGEGAVVMVLEREQREGHPPPHATLLGSATNQDGRTSGLTVPSGSAQLRVITAALDDAGLAAQDVSYVEAHGTGTSLGDPIEVRALAASLGARRSYPLLLGSLKANIGHLEAAAGIAGLAKTVLAIEKGSIPGQPAIDRLNSHLDWDTLPLSVVQATTAWPDERRIAGVSSFGYGGSNAHLIVGAAVEVPVQNGDGNPPQDSFPGQSVVVKMSAGSEEALRADAAAVARYVTRHPDLTVPQIAWTANTARADRAVRAVVVASSRDELVASLVDIAEGGSDVSRVLSGVPQVFIDATVASPRTTAEDHARMLATVTWLERFGLEIAAVKGSGARPITAATIAGAISTDLAHELIHDPSMPLPDFGGGDIPLHTDASPDSPAAGEWVSALPSPDVAERDHAVELAVQAWLQGTPIRWDAITPRPPVATRLPNSTWSRTLHWTGAATPPPAQPSAGTSLPAIVHLPSGGAVAEQTVTLRSFPVIDEHQVHGRHVVPGVVYFELVTRCAEHLLGYTPNLAALRIERPLVLTQDDSVVLNATLTPRADDAHDVLVTSRDANGTWHTHMRGRVERGQPVTDEGITSSSPGEPDPASMTGMTGMTGGEFYSTLWPRDFALGPSFTLLESVHPQTQVQTRTVTVKAPPPACAGRRSGIRSELLMLDACVQAAVLVLAPAQEADVRLGVGFTAQEGLDVALPDRVTATAVPAGDATADIVIRGADQAEGPVLGVLRGVRYGSVTPEQLDRATASSPLSSSTGKSSNSRQQSRDSASLVKDCVAHTLGFAPETVVDDLDLVETMDSIMLAEVADGLTAATGRTIDLATLLDLRTVGSVADHLRTGPDDTSHEASATEVGGDEDHRLAPVQPVSTSAPVIAVAPRIQMHPQQSADQPPAPTSSLKQQTATPSRPRRRANQLMSVDEMSELAELPADFATDIRPDDTLDGDVLLTGATGFVGSFLLAQLLDQTARDIVCLVRAEDPDHARRRLLEAGRGYGLDFSGQLDRIQVVVADLSAENFGLTSSQLTDLAARTSEIFHNAAEVKWSTSYDRLAPANVDGTLQILRFATQEATKPVHFTSTVGVFSSGQVIHDLVDEDTPLTSSGPLTVGYAQTKWVAEQMIRNAADRGLPTTIHRINTGPSRERGDFNRLDHLSMIIKGCIEAGVAPTEGRFPLQACPIDVVAARQVNLALNPVGGRTYHHLNPPMPWGQMFDHIRDAGYPLQPLDFDTWRQHVTSRSSGTMALLGLAPFLTNTLDTVHLAKFDGTITDEWAATRGLPQHRLDGDYIHECIAGFRRAHFIPDPPARTDSATSEETP